MCTNHRPDFNAEEVASVEKDRRYIKYINRGDYGLYSVNIDLVVTFILLWGWNMMLQKWNSLISENAISGSLWWLWKTWQTTCPRKTQVKVSTICMDIVHLIVAYYMPRATRTNSGIFVVQSCQRCDPTYTNMQWRNVEYSDGFCSL